MGPKLSAGYAKGIHAGKRVGKHVGKHVEWKVVEDTGSLCHGAAGKQIPYDSYIYF